MNDRMMNDRNDAGIVDLERSLRALADEDRHLQAPPHVHAAVMHRWDATTPVAARWHGARGRNATLLEIGSLAAAAASVVLVVAVVLMHRAPSATSARSAPLAPSLPAVSSLPEVSSVPSAPLPPEPVVARAVKTASEAGHGSRRLSRRRDPTTVSRDERGMVLVMDPTLDRSAASLVRVRVPRTALVTLGVPLVEPENGGSVDLEMLVGEDGIARTIVRAVPVAGLQE